MLYIASYSGVDVYEELLSGAPLMRRVNDDWVNATQILKAAGLPKAQRTRVLEKEVHSKTHEKIQGGYGRFQGTWVPLEFARQFAAKYCENIAINVLKYNPNVDPELERRKPKGRTAQPKQPKKIKEQQIIQHPVNNQQQRHQIPQFQIQHQNQHFQQPQQLQQAQPYNQFHTQHSHQHQMNQMNQIVQPFHQDYTSQLLNYFINDNLPIPQFLYSSPHDFNPNDPIDDEGHTPLHWATSLALLDVVQLLLQLGADPHILNHNGVNPLGKLVCFSNAYDNQSLPAILSSFTLNSTPFGLALLYQDGKGETTIHHIIRLLSSEINFNSPKVTSLNYYLYQSLLYLNNINKLSNLSNIRDYNGDTIWSAAAKVGLDHLVNSIVSNLSIVDTPRTIIQMTPPNTNLLDSTVDSPSAGATQTTISHGFENSITMDTSITTPLPNGSGQGNLAPELSYESGGKSPTTPPISSSASSSSSNDLLLGLKTFPTQFSMITANLSKNLESKIDDVNYLKNSISKIDNAIIEQDEKIQKLPLSPDEIESTLLLNSSLLEEKTSSLLNLIERYQALNVAKLVNQYEDSIDDKCKIHEDDNFLNKSIYLTLLQVKRQVIISCLVNCETSSVEKISLYHTLIASLCDVPKDGITEELLNGLETFLS